MDPVTAITAGLGIIKGLKSILPFFGEKSKRVAEAIDVIDDAVGDVKGGKLPPEAQLELRKLDIQELKTLVDDQANARAAIIAEVQSGDKWVRRARPTFLYMMYVVLFINFAVIPFMKICGAGASPVSLPSQLYWLMASGYLGYGYLRTSDKKGSFNPLNWMGGK